MELVDHEVLRDAQFEEKNIDMLKDEKQCRSLKSKEFHFIHLSMITAANWLINFISAIPLLGKKTATIFTERSLKKAVAVIAAILKVIVKLLKKAFFVGILMVLPVVLLEHDVASRYTAFLYLFFWLNLIGPLTTSVIFASDRTRYICIRLMHMNAKNFIVSTVLFRAATDFLCFLPSVCIATVWLQGTVLEGFLLTFISTAFDLAGEVYFLLSYKFSGKNLVKALPMFSHGVVFLLSPIFPDLSPSLAALRHTFPAAADRCFHRFARLSSLC